MSFALPTTFSLSPRARGLLPWSLLALTVLLLAGNVALHDRLFHREAADTAASATHAEAAPSPAAPTVVSLTAAKLQAAGIATEAARLEALPSELGVPGRIDANQDRQVRVRPRVPGVIREVRARLGQNVKKGQVLAVLDSAEVGTARLNLRAKQRELETVRTEAKWRAQVATNVATLIPELRKNTEAAAIERRYADRPLGSFRATLLQAYADFDIAAHEEKKTSDLSLQRIVGEHPRVVAQHNRESAQAKFEAVIEQAKFDANQQTLVANQEARLAEAAVIDAAQRLRILGVPEDVEALVSGAAAQAPADEDVTAYEVVAPFDGTVLTRDAVPSERADGAAPLFTLADLSTVWVTANIPESEFGLIPKLRGATLRVAATAYPGRSFGAKLLSVGAAVDPATRTVPLLAEVPNAEGLLKVGLFVRIVLDSATAEKALTVPGSAIVDLDGAPGVFVPEGPDGRTFALRTLKLGRQAGDRQVVLSGLSAGAPVVSRGAFTLKSELILQNETEEE